MGELVHLHPDITQAPRAITPAEVRQGISTLRELLLLAHDNLATVDDPAILARLELELAALKSDAGIWQADARRLLIDHVKAEGVDGVLDLTAEAGAVVTLDWSRTRKGWDSDRLYALVVQRALEAVAETQLVLDPDSGELVEQQDLKAAVIAVGYALHEALPVTPSVGWRVTALRAMGLDPADYCTEEPAVPRITVRPSGEQ